MISRAGPVTGIFPEKKLTWPISTAMSRAPGSMVTPTTPPGVSTVNGAALTSFWS
jgi:hypothetical protein